MGYEKMMAEHISAGLPCFAEWEQRPVRGKARPGSNIPCLLTHGTLIEHTSAGADFEGDLCGARLGHASRFPSDILDVMVSAG